MRTFIASVWIAVVAWSVLAGPVEGPQQFLGRDAFVPSTKKTEIGEREYQFQFKGGERASVVVIGDHRPVVDLELYVYEVNEQGTEGKLVAQDGGPGLKDRVGVVWYPPRTATYRIVIRNPSEYEEKSNPYNECSIAIR
jgi:hypothetical protein